MAQQAYQGGCHCGAVRFKARLDLDHTVSCNCSRCSKVGSVLTFAPAEHFELVAGEDKLTDYWFNKHVIRHQFCAVCGIEPFALGSLPDGTAMVAINANCLDDVDAKELSPAHYDGRSL